MTKEDKELIIKAFAKAISDITVDVDTVYGYDGEKWFEATVNTGYAVSTFEDIINEIEV